MIPIENFYRHKEYASFDKNDGVFHAKTYVIHDNEKTAGYYVNLVNVMIVLFKDDQILLCVNGITYPFNTLEVVTHDVAQWKNANGAIRQKRNIEIRSADLVVLDVDYSEIMDTFENDFTPFLEDEDFDFGLFLENLSKKRECQQRLFQG